MIRLENQYFHVSRILLLIIGLWPYQQSKLTRLWFIFLCSIQMTAIFFQFTIFLTSKCTFDLVIKVLSVTTILALSMATYVSFSTNTEVMKDFIEQLQYVYNTLKDENEHAIVEKYDYNAKLLLIIVTVTSFCGSIGFLITQCWPRFFDVILPMNKSGPHNILFVTEYFVDQERYIVLILLHMNAALVTGVAGLLATGAILFTYLLHICAMFRIASYRLECTIKINILENNRLKRKNVICNNIINAVDIHRRAMKFETMLLCLVIGLVVLMSLNLLRVSQIMLSKNDTTEILPFLSVILCVLYMFIGHSAAQMVIDHNSHVFVTAYNIQWYIAPLYIQKMILFVLQKGSKDLTLSIGGIFFASLECFASLTKASISYFTVMYSIR
ncbi:odorant receptor 43a-like isoform X2 [Linepithema humile]|uniref:odorant receptor 43a-like isoform X2 n=1 Tax=Linepithema humile TaxID=83485 RepID=UPI00351E6256